jgi:ABC-type lipoprotein export system ATPase subunit
MIELHQVTKTYPGQAGMIVPAVLDVSLVVHPNDFLIVVGRSGSGKTTLLNLMAGLTRPTAGRVTLDGADLWAGGDAKQSRLRNQLMGFVFQFPSLLPFLSVEENVAMPAGLNGGDRAAARDQALGYIEKVGLSDKRKALPRQLSAGQQQRAVIARSLLNQPRLLFADEPTSNLDERTEREILDLFAEIHAGLGVTIVLVTHTRQLLSYGTHAVEMAEGRIANGKETLG